MGKKFTIKSFAYEDGQFSVTLHLRQKILGNPSKTSALYDLLVVLINQESTSIIFCNIKSHQNPCVATVAVIETFAKIHTDARRAAESVCDIANQALEIVLAS